MTTRIGTFGGELQTGGPKNVQSVDTGENIPFSPFEIEDEAPVSTSGGGTGSGGPVSGGTATTSSAAAAPAPGADQIPSLSIMTGANMQWFRDADGNYFVAYGLPNSSTYAFFEATPPQMDALFGPGARPGTTAINSISDLTGRSGYHFSGNITEVAGTGSFESAVNRTVALALDGSVPEWMANSPEIWDTLYIAEAESKSDDWVLQQIRNTQAFQGRFPGIQNFEKLGLTLGDSVKAFMEYETSLKQVAQRYPGMGLETVTPQVVGDLAGKGHSVQDVEFVFDIFDRMNQSQASFQNFNEILAERGLQPLGQADQFRFLSGQAPSELYKVWEENSILTAAEQSNIAGFSAAEALEIARNTPGITSEQQAFEGMSQAAKLLLQFRREVSLGRLDQDDLIDLSLGSAPRSGRSQAELAQEISRIVREAEAFIGNKVRPFVQFTETGKPKASSLGELAKNQSVD